ncbi:MULTISPECIES: DUF2273 domain-containing protein [Loigolactobacillus]|uniref:Uncharacterized protein n=1 Tax=Loigolactobacillus backii TaxID=375175 RepID=A0A192H013_9LACO|nr:MULTISPECIES: DUF2273 domain-containing protein [Loigolactobacillus]ANK60811.1 hypothetical protein AYR52_11435 [Loigolactobacillus backii]ANK61618.1 hypothetical protein AYR53_01885 [Loigolactobacillus backii]ANK65765.1 hypothetical protein AYR54_11230 [Loigolactobacillus backii]ANK68241.1 hypothetical protein AYR55_11380 [Loigolactobacillus backii]ANK69182.1 hypothetical protein AYR56_02825 [Loigolactobacillus backii]
MTNGTIGAIIGVIVGLIWIMLGFIDLIIIALLALVGFLIGKYVKGGQTIRVWLNQLLDR